MYVINPLQKTKQIQNGTAQKIINEIKILTKE